MSSNSNHLNNGYRDRNLNNNNNNNNSNSNGRMHHLSPQQINSFGGGGSGGGGSHHYHHNSRRYASQSSNNNNGYRQQRNHYSYGSSHYNNNNNNKQYHSRSDRHSNWSTTIENENNNDKRYYSNSNSNNNYKSYSSSSSSSNKYRYNNFNKQRSNNDNNNNNNNDDEYYNWNNDGDEYGEEYNEEEDQEYIFDYDEDDENNEYEDEEDNQDLDYGRTYGSQFTIDEIAELESAMEIKGDEYLDVDGRPPPFEYDINNPPMPLKKEQLNPGDILCVYHPNFCFWYVNYGFHGFADETQELVLKSLDPRLEEDQRELRIPCSFSWPLIYRYTRANKETQSNTESEQVTLSSEKQVTRKLEIQKKKLLEITWDGKDEEIIKNLNLYWTLHKNSFLRCLNLVARSLKIPNTTYGDLTVVSGAGIFRWKEAFDDEYSKMGNVDEEIQLLNRTSLLQLEQVWTDAWRSQTTDKDDSVKTEYIKGLEERVVESLKKKALVLTHDNNGHFGILCAYKALKDLTSEMKFLEKPANYVFLLRKFVLNEDKELEEKQNEDQISIASRKHVVFVKAKDTTNCQNNPSFEKTEKIRSLKEALQTAIQAYYCNEKENTDETLNETNDNISENVKNENKNDNENENVKANDSTNQITNQIEEPKDDIEQAPIIKEENHENKNIAVTKIEEDNTKENGDKIKMEELEEKISNPEEEEEKTFNPEVEGKLGFKRWIECLSPDRPLKNELYMLSLHCLMLFYDARHSLISYLDKFVSEEKEITGELSHTNSALTLELENTKQKLTQQTKLIYTAMGKNFEEFDGSFTKFALPDNIKMEERNERREQLRALVEVIAEFEKTIMICYENIVKHLP